MRRPGDPGAAHPAACRDLTGQRDEPPSEITAGCGLGWRMLPEDWQAWQSQLNDAGYDAATPVEQ